MSTVGYDMYLKLIEQAVSEAQGVEVTPELDTRVELAVDAFLPESYVPEEKLRVEIYKRIAMIQDEAGRMDIERSSSTALATCPSRWRTSCALPSCAG